MVQIQTNVHRIAELLAVSDDEAFLFYSEVKQRFQPIVPVYAVLKNVYKYSQENNSSKPTSQEIVDFIVKHEIATKFRIIDVKLKQEELKLSPPAKPAKMVVFISDAPSVEPELDWALKFRLDFSRRLNKAYDEVASEYCVQKSVRLFDLDEYAQAELKFYAIKRIYTDEDASNHIDMHYRTEFLKSSYWTIISRYLLLRQRRYRDQCVLCGESSPQTLDVHHRVGYDNHGWEHEHLEDLIVICRRCHQDEEQEKKHREYWNRY